jgi:CBS domain-containing protein
VELSLSDFYHSPLRPYITPTIIWVKPSDSVHKAVELMSQNNVGCLLVRYENGKIGLISERDVVREYAMELYDFFEKSVADIMTVCPVTIDANECLGKAFELMHHHHIRHLPVCSGRDVVGIVSVRDLAEAFVGAIPKRTRKPNRAKSSS